MSQHPTSPVWRHAERAERRGRAVARPGRLERDELRLAMAAPAPFGGFVSRYHRVAGVSIHVRERPNAGAGGPAWVLVHGLAVSHRYLMPTAAALPNGPVHVPDLPGFGLSAKPRRIYDPAAHAQTLAAWMDLVGIGAAGLLANSYGCQVAVELAVGRPDLVAALVLVGPTVDPAAPTAAGQVRRWLRDVPREHPRQARIIARDLRDAGMRRVLGTLLHSTRHRMDRRLPAVRAPTLVLRGEHDPIAPPRWVAQAAVLAPHGHCGVVAGPAHNAMTTAGPQVAARAAAFLAGTSC